MSLDPRWLETKAATAKRIGGGAATTTDLLEGRVLSLFRLMPLPFRPRMGHPGSARLASRPLVLVLALLVAVAAAGGCGKKEKTRLFVIGLDGATWDLLDPWIEAGDLPNIQRFREESAWGTMNSVIPYLSPPAWTSAVTGVNPGRHGIFDFQRRLPGQSVIVTETSKSRRSPPLWNLLKDTGRRVAIINVPMTDPPDEVDGVMVAGFPHLDQDGYTWPASLEQRCEQMGYILDHMELKLPPGQEEAELRTIVTGRDKRWELARQLYAEEDYDLFWVVFTGTDRVQHLFWKFDDPENPNYDPAVAARFRGTIRQFWIDQDRILGEIFAMLRPQTWVMVLSDHGFGPIHRELRAGNFLRDPNTPLAADEVNDVFTLDRSDAARLYVREPGRDPGGTRGAEARAAIRQRLQESLERYVDGETGTKPIEATYPKEQIFVGKYAEKGPDLTLMPSLKWYVSWGDQDTGFKLSCCGPLLATVSGWHRMNGLWMLRGPASATGQIERPFNLLDITPTCLYLMGRPVPEDMEGEVMQSAFDPSWFGKREPVRQGLLNEEDRPMTPEEERALKNLPYVGG